MPVESGGKSLFVLACRAMTHLHCVCLLNVIKLHDAEQLLLLGGKNTSYDALALKYVKMHKIETAI